MPNPNVQFGGSSLVLPGAYSVIDASQLVPASRGLGNVLAILGDATGGQPGVPLYFRNGNDAKAILRSGGLLDAIRFAYDPALAPDRPGADLIVAIRLDPATQSTLALAGSTGTSITLTSVDWGVWTTNIKAKVEAGTTTGKKVTIQYVDAAQGTINEVFDNVAATRAAIIAALNSGIAGQRAASSFVTAAAGADATVPVNVAFTALATGIDGTTTSTQWTNALNALQAVEVHLIVPLTQDQTIVAQVQAHVEQMSGLQFRQERLAFVGSSNNFATNALYLADLQTNAAAIASSRVALCAPGIKRPNANGVLTTYGPEFLAATIAGLVAGQQVGDSPTHKYVKAAGIDFGFTTTDQVSLILAGVTCVEFVRGQGFRVVQGVTTWQQDANPMFREISVRRVGDFLMQDIRRTLEAEFVGGRADSMTLAAMLARVVSRLNQAVADRVIVAYQNVSLSLQSSVARVSFEFSPTEPLNFILITGFALPTSLAVSFTGQASFGGATP